MKLKLYHSISSTTITQEVIANFLETERYENHLRKLRHTLHANSLQYIRAVGDYFPEGTRVSRPQGGFVIWVEMDKKRNALDLYEKAIRQKISIAPGRMFTLQDQYQHCLRLSYGIPWSEKVDAALRTVGKLAKGL
jgi:DNA-binding transcriptional MocR family regulator